MSNFLNMLVIFKKVYWLFNKFIIFSKNIINVGVLNDVDDEDLVEEILD